MAVVVVVEDVAIFYILKILSKLKIIF